MELFKRQHDYGKGLTEKEAAKRLNKYGKNVFAHGKKVSPVGLFAAQFKDILIVILIVSTLLSVLMGEMTEAIAILTIVILNAVLGFIQEFRTEKTLDALKNMAAPNARVMRDGHAETIPAADIVPGDVILFEAGDRIPSDARLTEAYELLVDESLLTGESVPVNKKAARLDGNDDEPGMVFMGTMVTRGNGKAVTQSTGMSTEMGKIAGMLNRRQIQTRIARLNEELEKLVLQRQTQRRQRNKTGIPVVSLVGYTNAGKSSIMNRILESNDQPQEKFVLEKDQLFATLETSVRSITLPDNKSFLLTDTVGFISKLPHHLVKAFRSTLEEVSEADLLIHVVDSSDPDCEEQIAVTTETLRELGAGQIPTIYAFNKSDLTDIRPAARDDNSIYLSAKNKTGLDDLMALIRKKIFEDYIRCEMLIPYHRGEVLSYLNQNAHIFSSSYEADGTRLLVECRTSDFNRFHDFVTDQNK